MLDCGRPELSGVRLVQGLRKSPKFGNFPVMILTARSSDRDEEPARFAGVADDMKKAFDLDELVFRIEELLASGL
jgi:DNA-binding response OmpR family regulator